MGMPVYQLLDDLLHQFWWIYLALVGSKGRYTYPLLVSIFEVDGWWKQTQVAAFGWEDALEVHLDGISQTLKDFQIVLERGGLLDKLLVVLGSQPATIFSMFVDMGHLIVTHVEAQTQELRA